MPSTCQLDAHPGQNWNTSHTAFDNGRNDGFVRAHQMAHPSDPTAHQPMQYLVRNDVPVSWALADAYATAAFAMGAAARDWTAALDGYEAFALDANGYSWQTPGFGRYLA